MQIVVPMSGSGQRFIDAGYTLPKPLIEVDGKPIIEHVVGLFPGEYNFYFICNKVHLETTDMRNTLNRIAPDGVIISIEPHKLGPVFAVSKIFDRIEENEEVIVSYCDFGTYWDCHDFLQETRALSADGAVVSYRGFHPHMLGTTNYAFMRSTGQTMLEIREKKPFTNNRMNEYASNGTYYFRNGAILKKYFQELMDTNCRVGNEYYVSMVYNLLVRDGLKVSIYEIQHMLQWGTPDDLEEYQSWSDYFRKVATAPQRAVQLPPGSISLMPMAGYGSRFAKQGFDLPKPLIPVNGKPMFAQAMACLPNAEKKIFVCLQEHCLRFGIDQQILSLYPDAKIVTISEVTKGQAITCSLGLQGEDLDAPLMIGACDNGMLWDTAEFETLLKDPSADLIVWSFRRHVSSRRNPHMYGWIKVDSSGTVELVSVKVPISDNPYEDHAIVGAFYFAKARYFVDALDRMVSKNIRVNGEFYVDSLINETIGLGLNVKVFEVDHYVSWGMPEDYMTYQYWQSFLHKCSWHPFRVYS